MPIVSVTTARPKTLPWRCRPRKLLPRNPAPKNLGPKKQSKPTARPPLCTALMSPSSLIARKRRRSIKKRNKTRKTLLWPSGIILLRVRKAMRNITIARKKAILQGTARNLQKTSVSISNLCANDWWWWGDCQAALHLLSGWISEKSGVSKGLAR